MPEEGENRNEAVSVKKLLKGDSSRSTRKTFVGWTLEFMRQTQELPAHRREEFEAIFEQLRGRKRASEKKWRKSLGKLRFLARGIPGCPGLFSALQLALNRASDGRIQITQAVRHHLDTFVALMSSSIAKKLKKFLARFLL